MPLLKEQFARPVAWTSEAPLGLTVVRAEGPYVYLAEGWRIIDFTSGIARHWDIGTPRGSRSSRHR